MNFPESHPISHCKPELDQKAGILAPEERQLERNSTLARLAGHPQSEQTRGLKGSMGKFKKKSYKLSYGRMEMVKFTLQKKQRQHQCTMDVFLHDKTP